MAARRRDRIASALGALALQGLIVLALILGLRVHFEPAPDRAPLLIADIAPVTPPAPRAPQRAGEQAKDAAGAANLRAEATDIVAGPPVVVLPVPPPIVAAPVVGTGAAADQGAADVAGPGVGAGGYGDGRGGGGQSMGGTPPRWLKGSLRNADYPRGAIEAAAGGAVGVRYRVGMDGRAFQCLVTRSSGNDELDATTCALIERRFRFAPARDEDGRPVISTIVETHEWVMQREPPSR